MGPKRLHPHRQRHPAQPRRSGGGHRSTLTGAFTTQTPFRHVRHFGHVDLAKADFFTDGGPVTIQISDLNPGNGSNQPLQTDTGQVPTVILPISGPDHLHDSHIRRATASSGAVTFSGSPRHYIAATSRPAGRAGAHQRAVRRADLRFRRHRHLHTGDAILTSRMAGSAHTPTRSATVPPAATRPARRAALSQQLRSQRRIILSSQTRAGLRYAAVPAIRDAANDDHAGRRGDDRNRREWPSDGDRGDHSG